MSCTFCIGFVRSFRDLGKSEEIRACHNSLKSPSMGVQSLFAGHENTAACTRAPAWNQLIRGAWIGLAGEACLKTAMGKEERSTSAFVPHIWASHAEPPTHSSDCHALFMLKLFRCLCRRLTAVKATQNIMTNRFSAPSRRTRFGIIQALHPQTATWVTQWRQATTVGKCTATSAALGVHRSCLWSTVKTTKVGAAHLGVWLWPLKGHRKYIPTVHTTLSTTTRFSLVWMPEVNRTKSQKWPFSLTWWHHCSSVRSNLQTVLEVTVAMQTASQLFSVTDPTNLACALKQKAPPPKKEQQKKNTHTHKKKTKLKQNTPQLWLETSLSARMVLTQLDFLLKVWTVIGEITEAPSKKRGNF